MKKLLIANRGEIAVRIIRTARRLGLATVAVYSDPDRDSPHVSAADERAALGGAAAADSYLRIDKLLAAAQAHGADAVHPGYGFLAEDASFAEQVASAGLIFVGPPAAVLRSIGNKDSARKLAKSCGVAVPEGYDGEDQSPATLAAAAAKLGFPLLVKAVAGGGGRGMRLISGKEGLADALASAKREAEAFFGDGRLILEQYLSPARHIEVQLIGDSAGNVCHLFERDCSLQRRYQKLIEEAPARNLPEKVRSRLLDAATVIGKAAKLRGAATAEFLVPLKAVREPFYFLEVNPRIQVEHPVTEMITGLDLVELQLRVARGEKLPFAQKDVKASGHAIEARVCAEAPLENFRPSGGRITALTLPADSATLRLDHALARGFTVSTNYDSLVLKVIAGGKTAAEATKRLGAALEAVLIGGPETNAAFLINVLRGGRYGGKEVPDTGYLDTHLSEFVRPASEAERAALAERALAGHLAGMFLRPDTGARPLTVPPLEFHVESASLGEKWSFRVELHEIEAGAVAYSVGGKTVRAKRSDAREAARLGTDLWSSPSVQNVEQYNFRVERMPSAVKAMTAEMGGALKAQLPGRVIAVNVSAGQKIKAGDTILVIESMKMEHAMRAAADGEVKEVRVAAGATVKEGQVLVVLVDAQVTVTS